MQSPRAWNPEILIDEKDHILYIWVSILGGIHLLGWSFGRLPAMNAREREALNRIIKGLRKQFPRRIREVYAFGSKARGDHGEWSDFDVLVVVKDRNPSIEEAIISVFVDEELRTGLLFTPLVKDLKAFESEKKFSTPFYENLVREGIALW
jgi:predicted nucleotidyltransferase